MSDTASKTAMGMVGAAKGRVENLTPDQVEEELKNADTVLVDVRDSAERSQKGTIPGAIPIDRGMLEFRADDSTPYHHPELRRDRRIILHCASGGRSALAADTLQQMDGVHECRSSRRWAQRLA